MLWWVLQGCDPDGYVPSPAEAAGKGVAASWVKNRNVILRWEALQTALRQVSGVGSGHGAAGTRLNGQPEEGMICENGHSHGTRAEIAKAILVRLD